MLGLGLFLWGDRAVPLTGLAAGSDTGDRCLGSFAYLASGPPFWWAVSTPWTDSCALTDALRQAGGPGPTPAPSRPRCPLYTPRVCCPAPLGHLAQQVSLQGLSAPWTQHVLLLSPSRHPQPVSPTQGPRRAPFPRPLSTTAARLVGLECANAVLPSVLRLSGSCPTASMGRAQAR